MKKLIGCLSVVTLFIAVMIAGCSNPSPSSPVNSTAYLTPQTTPQASVNLGTSANYVILAYSNLTNSGPSTTCGGYGIYPDGTSSVTGSPAIVEICSGAIDEGDPTANIAKQDLNTAYTNVAGRSGGASIPSGADIGGQTLYPGLYTDGGNLSISSSSLTLNGNGNSNSVFIFQVSGILNVTSGRQVILTNGAQAANVFWQVTNYCSLGTTASMVGNIMAYNSVTLNTGAVLTGRALGENGNVTLLSNTITRP